MKRDSSSPGSKRHPDPRNCPSPSSSARNASKKVLAANTTFDFQNKTLDEVAKHFEGQTRENFVLDPAARRKGALDPEASVTGSGKDVPLQEGLKKLLDPLGLKLTIRDEVVVITSKSMVE